jgi:hypothetical protein
MNLNEEEEVAVAAAAAPAAMTEGTTRTVFRTPPMMIRIRKPSTVTPLKPLAADEQRCVVVAPRESQLLPPMMPSDLDSILSINNPFRFLANRKMTQESSSSSSSLIPPTSAATTTTPAAPVVCAMPSLDEFEPSPLATRRRVLKMRRVTTVQVLEESKRLTEENARQGGYKS